MIDTIRLAVSAAGAAANASGSAQTVIPLYGEVLAVHLDYSSLTPDTADVRLHMAGSPSEEILSIDNTNASAWYYPRRQVHDNTGQVLAYATTASAWQKVADPYVVHGPLELTIAGGDPAADAAIATVYLRK